MKTFAAIVTICLGLSVLGAEGKTAARYALCPGGTVSFASGIKLFVVAYPGGWRGKSAIQTGLDEPDAKGSATWTLCREKIQYGKGRTTVAREADGRVHCRFEVEMTDDFDSQGLMAAAHIPIDEFVGAQWEDSRGTNVVVPVKSGELALANGRVDWFAIRPPDAGATSVRCSLPGGGTVLLEDGRRWYPHLTLRITIAPPGRLARGAKFAREILFDEPGELDIRSVLTIRSDETYVPFAFRKRIVPGSALDFSSQGFLDGPAGKYGWVRSVAGHFEFENRPGDRLRFWGTNLSIGAPVVPHETSIAYLDALARTGYNTIRIHNSERQFLKGSPDGLTLNAENMERFDFLFAEGKKRGFYFTTDLFIQRDAPWRRLGFDRDGTCRWQLLKALILVHDGAFENWKAFTRNLLVRRNPYTGLLYSEDPALAFLSLINEGLCTWQREAFDDPVVRVRWKTWLAAKRAADPAFCPKAPADCAGLTIVPGSETFAALDLFVGELERAFCVKARAFLRSLGVKALLTDWNCGTKMSATQQAVTDELDYVDRHFYVDHPVFVRAGGVYSTSGNSSPVATPDSHPGAGEGYARVPGRPLTVSEWNHCGPSPYRAVGGLMTGAFACLRDWDALWHFNYAIQASDVEDGGGRWDSFTIANDPLMIFMARMGSLLYLRREIDPLPEGTDFRPSALSGAVSFAKRGARRESLAVSTPRSAGGFVRAGETLSAGGLTARVEGFPATVFASALSGATLAEADRLVLFHLTDVQIEGCRFLDETYSTLLDWKGNRPLVRTGAAEIALRLARPQECEVWALETDGSRVRHVDSRVVDGALRFTARIAHSTPHFVYEIVRRSDAPKPLTTGRGACPHDRL